MIACSGTAFADTGVPAVPEVQGLTTGTVSDVVGTVTETDSGAWTLTNDPLVVYSYSDTGLGGMGISHDGYNAIEAQLQAAGGSISGVPITGGMAITQFNIPQSVLTDNVNGFPGTWEGLISFLLSNLQFSGPVVTDRGLHTGVLDPGQVQYTAGYNSLYSGVSGQQTFTKSAVLSTANQIATGSNINTNTNIQFVAVNSGRATNAEDILLDGAAQAQNSSGLILCPFANANPGIIPAFCNIEQAGSSFDSTLTSTVTSTGIRFIGTGVSAPTVLNYDINSQGITMGNQSSPMIGSVSAYLKVHVQEARNESIISGTIPIFPNPAAAYSLPDSLNPQKSEDLVYSETSSASGLISGFHKSMSYSSQASGIDAPVSIIPEIPPRG